MAKTRDWALSAAWGMAVLIFMGGLAAALSLATPALMFLLTVAGVAFAGLRLRSFRMEWAAAGVLASALIFWYAPAVACTQFEPYDDYLAYFPFVRRLFETGTLIEPFSLRRLAAYGGQSWLHAVVTLFGSEKNMNLLDRGIAPVLFGALVYQLARERTGARWSAALALTAMTVPIARQNTMSQATGLMLWLALFRSSATRSPVAVGLVAAALCALRSSYIPAAVLALLLLPLANRTRWRECMAACGVALVGVAPWALLLWRSSGTFVYPLFAGNQRPGFSYSAGADLHFHMAALVDCLLNPAVLFLFVPVVAALVYASYRSKRLDPCSTRDLNSAHGAFLASAIVSSALLAWSLPLPDGNSSVFRYLQPFALGSSVIAWHYLAVAPRLRAGLALALTPLLAMSAFIGIRERAAWPSAP